MHPLLKLIATEPQLLADHAEAYASLVSAEVGAAALVWRRRAMLEAAALAAFGVAAVLAGVALMLWAVIPPADIRAPWALIAAPVLPLLAGLLCKVTAGSPSDAGGLATLRGQVRADIALLREASVR